RGGAQQKSYRNQSYDAHFALLTPRLAELSYCHTILCELCFSFKAMGASEEKRGLLMLVPVSRSSHNVSNPDSLASCAQAGIPKGPARMAWMSRRAVTAAILCAVAFDFEARAQQFPTQPIHLILGFAPGGITDFTGRIVAGRLSKILGGNPVISENRPGA